VEWYLLEVSELLGELGLHHSCARDSHVSFCGEGFR
jgi:hypothetical protein